MRFFPETIYQSLYVQGRGSLKKELTKHLRQGRTKRRARSRMSQPAPPRMSGMVNISARPPEVADRVVPGDWEGELIIGRHQESAIGTLVERSTRFVRDAAVDHLGPRQGALSARSFHRRHRREGLLLRPAPVVGNAREKRVAQAGESQHSAASTRRSSTASLTSSTVVRGTLWAGGRLTELLRAA